MLACLLVIAANSSTCTGGQDPDTVAKRNALISTMEMQVSQYQVARMIATAHISPILVA